jgi:hypothetical protein
MSLGKPPRSRRPGILFTVVLVAAGITYVLPFRQPNCNTSSHYALVQMIANGEKTIDPIHGESCDISWWRNHYYANKAPGLALVTVPWYLALHALGALQPDPLSARAFPTAMRAIPRRDLWLMGLWGAVLPALGLLVLVRSVAEKVAPGTGVVAAATLAFATLFLPFSSLFFAHVLTAFLVFASFALLLDLHGASWRRIGSAGALAGFASVVDYPAGLLVLALVTYAASREPRIARSAAFLAGAAVGLAPLAAYNLWAFGSPLHLSYLGAVTVPGITGHDVLGANSVGFFGVALPHLSRGLQVLFGNRGLLTLGPVLALAPIGCAHLWKSARKREAALVAGVAAVYLVYNAGYYSPLGGATPGPRFLITVLPFAVLGVAAAVRAWPLSTLALALPSAALLLAAHLTQPLISPPYQPHDWWHWLRTDGLSSTVLSPGAHTWLPALPIVIAALVALAAAVASVQSIDRIDFSSALVCAIGWLTALAAFPHLARSFVGALAIATTFFAIAIARRIGIAGVTIIAVAGPAVAVVHRQPLLATAVGMGAFAVAISASRLIDAAEVRQTNASPQQDQRDEREAVRRPARRNRGT